jgi:hypothetical protein
MTTFSLFGVPYTVAPGQTVKNGVTLTWDPAAKTLAIAFNDQVPTGTASFEATFAAQQTGSTLTISGAPISVRKTLTVAFDLNGFHKLPTPTMQGSADAFGIVFTDNSGLIGSLLGSTLVHPPTWLVLPGTHWTSATLSFDQQSAIHRPLAPGFGTVTVNDSLKSQLFGKPALLSPQVCYIDVVRTYHDHADISARPKSGVLYLHADVLDTTATDLTPGGAANDLLYQYAVANGELFVVAPIVGSGSASWQPQDGQSGPPALVLMRWQDEHGHPVAFCPTVKPGGRPQVNGFALQQRAGTPQAVHDARTVALWSQTNQTAVIANSDGSAIEGALCALDPVKLYLRYNRPNRLSDPIGDPDFAVNGTVPVTATSPREIQGVGNGVWLVTAAASAASAAPPIAAHLTVQSIDSPTVKSVFHQSEIVVGTDGNGITGWSLKALPAEQRYHPDQIGTVGSRIATAVQGAANLRLPAIDTAFAISNLAGIKRATTDGQVLSDGFIVQKGQGWHQDLEAQFVGPDATHFRPGTPALQTHDQGFRWQPPQPQSINGVPTAQPFHGVLAAPPVSASSSAETARTTASMAANVAARNGTLHAAAAMAVGAAPPAFSAQYLFGGDPSGGTTVTADAWNEVTGTAAKFDPLFAAFEKMWGQPPDGTAPGIAVQALKDALGILPRPATAPNDDDIGQYLATANETVADDAEADRLSADDVEGLDNQFYQMFPEDFADIWASPDDAWLTSFLERVWSPPDFSLMRRTYSAIWSELIANVTGAPPQPIPPQISPAELTTLRGLLPLNATTVGSLISLLGKGLALQIQQGVDALYSELADLWNSAEDPLGILDSLRARYGPTLTPDVYKELLASPGDAALLLQALDGQLSRALDDLADVKLAPPEYLFVTKRFPVTGAADDTDIEQIWSTNLPLCRPQAGVDWTYFLNDSASAIVKLLPGRSIKDIFLEVEANYRSPQRPDPFDLGADGDRNDFFAAIDPDVLAPDWLGIFVVKPTIDIGRDSVLRDLVGFDHIEARYIAVGGRRPGAQSSAGGAYQPPIEVWASIHETAAATDLKKDPIAAFGDLKFALIKFDVTVRQSKITAADIVFVLQIKDLLGRTSDQSKFDDIYLHGTLSKPSDAAGQTLTFGARFETPYVANLSFAFLKQISLSSISVAAHNGATCIDIDGQLALMKPTTNLGFDIELVDPSGPGLTLSLKDFRIRLPRLPAGMSIPIGGLRNLSFDFPALSFALPHPRAFNIFGVEFLPTGLGYVRSDAETALAAFAGSFSWLSGFAIPGPGLSCPYIEFDVDFGKLPQFGASDVRGLRFHLAIAFQFHNPDKDLKATIGLSGLDATNVKIDFFRLLTLTMSKFFIGPAISNVPLGGKPAKTPDIGVIAAIDAQLRILGWSPSGDTPLSIILAHPIPSSTKPLQKGAALWFAPQSSDGSFFSVDWMILGHNIALDPTFAQYLLGADFSISDAFPPLLDFPASIGPPPVLHASLTDEESWLLGLSFKLGSVFPKCTLVLNDHHYYGVRLYADWLKAVLGMDRLELAYIAGDAPNHDRFRIATHVPALEVLGLMRSGEVALEWSPSWDFLIDIGFPWRVGDAYQWDRAFDLPFGVYEAQFGLYFEKQSVPVPNGRGLQLSAGMGFYVGYGFQAGSSVAWVRAGIGVFAIIQGTVVFEIPGPITDPLALLKSTIYSITVEGVIGIYAFGEGGINIWIISARFRVSVQAAIACDISYTKGAPCMLAYSATLEAEYSASVQVGCGFFSWTFSVHGSVGMDVEGHTLLG